LRASTPSWPVNSPPEIPPDLRSAAEEIFMFVLLVLV
jgi:hypothetical protein